MKEKMNLINISDLILTLLITFFSLLFINKIDKFSQGLLIFAIISAYFLLLFSIRNNWTCYHIIKFNDKQRQERINLLYGKNFINSNIITQYVEGYNSVLFKFWIWDFNKFIHTKKETINVIP